MRIGSLFSGIGGLELGLERSGLGRVVWQCEIDPYCRRVLAKHWPDALRYEDVTTLRGAHDETCDLDDLDEDCICAHEVAAPVDLICGGFPCQNISSAGNRVGICGARSGLWLEMLRLVRELRPRYVIVENVADLSVRGIDAVLGGLAESGYDAVWFPLRASDVGAPHRRGRVFVVAYCNGVGLDGEPTARVHLRRTPGDDADRRHRFPPGPSASDAWRKHTESGHCGPALFRGADGFPGGLDTRRRLTALGNAVVPQVAEMIGRAIVAAEAA